MASEQPFHAYLAALLCRGVHANLESKMHKNKSKESGSEGESEMGHVGQESKESKTQTVSTKFMSLNDWEGLSMEMVEWNLVLWQLGCLLPLSRLSSCLPSNGLVRQPRLEVSVKMLLDKGKGKECQRISTILMEV